MRVGFGQDLEVLGRKRLENIAKLSGGEVKWQDWSFNFKNAVRQQSKLIGKLMDWVDKYGKIGTEAQRGNPTSDEYGSLKIHYEGVENVAVESYQQLIAATDHGAMQLARTVEEGSGIRAGGKLHGQSQIVVEAHAGLSGGDVPEGGEDAQRGYHNRELGGEVGADDEGIGG